MDRVLPTPGECRYKMKLLYCALRGLFLIKGLLLLLRLFYGFIFYFYGCCLAENNLFPLALNLLLP